MYSFVPQESPVASLSRSEKVLFVTNIALAGIDLGQTLTCLGRSDCKELNPLYQSPASAIIIKSATTAAILYAIHKYTKPHSKLRYASLILYAAIQGIVISHNFSVLH